MLYKSNKYQTCPILEFADDQLREPQMVRFVFEGIKNSLGKGENAGDQHFCLFPQYLQKASLGS